MKSTIYNYIQRQSLRFSFCAIALACATVSFAQDEFDGDDMSETVIKAPKRAAVKDNNKTVTVQGVVIDAATKKPLAGVRLQTLNDHRYAAMTNEEGKFSIKVPTFSTSLYVQAPNYMSQQVAINANDEKQVVKIAMLSSAFNTMYENGTTYTAEKSIVTSGNGIVIDDEISSRLGADVRSIIRTGTEENGAFMMIRGINSVNAGTQPLVILDGVELDMQHDRLSIHQGDIFNMLSTISPDDINKVTVLKNATALYGARGANGVIIIETKRGHSMATRIDAKISAGLSLVPTTQTMLNADQYRNYAVEMLGTVPELQKKIASGQSVHFNFLNDDPSGYYYHKYHNETDWKDYVYRNAITQNYSINVQGGDDIGMYNLSVGYLIADKNVEKTSFDRINVRFNTDISILYNLKTKFDMSFSRTNTWLFDYGFAENMSRGAVVSPTNLALIKSPLLYPYRYNQNVNGFTSLYEGADDLYDAIGTGYSLANPLALMVAGEGDRKNKNENTFFNASIQPTYTINDHLNVTTHFSYYLNRSSQAYYRPNAGVPSFYVEGLGTVYSKVSSLFAKETNILSNTFVTWENKYGAHNIKAFGGFRYNYFSYDSSDLASEYDNELPDDKDPKLSAAEFTEIKGANDVWKNMQWYASADYSYMNRYFATVSLLAESNSRFGKNMDAGVKLGGVKWAFFPSVQLGWLVSNENWFPKHVGIDYLNVHAGFDMSGNDGISNYAAHSAYTSIKYNGNEIGAQLTNIGNDLIKNETTKKWNAGFNANILNNRVSINADFYIHRTSDLLALKSFETPVGGINNYWVNDGELENKGFEVSISGKPIIGKNLNLEVGASMGHYDNKILSLATGNYTSSIYGEKNILTAVGQPVGMFYGYQTAGIFSSDEEAKAATPNGKLVMLDSAGNPNAFNAGDVHFVDQNGDGIISDLDKVVIGNPNPDIYGNIFAKLTYKRFAVDMAFNYCLGNDVYNYERSILNSGATLYNQQVAEVHHWRYEGQRAELPKLAYGDPMGNNRFSDRWIEDGSYLRLKNLTVSYQIPIPESWESWLQGISVWGEAHNLFTLTHYKGNDPEFSVSNSQLYQGIDCGNLTQTRSFVLGVKINL